MSLVVASALGVVGVGYKRLPVEILASIVRCAIVRVDVVVGHAWRRTVLQTMGSGGSDLLSLCLGRRGSYGGGRA